MRRWAWSSGLVVGMSCSGTESDGEPARASASTPEAERAVSPADDAVVPAVAPEDGGAAVPEPEPIPLPAPTPAVTVAFHPVVTSKEWLGLHPLLDGTLMISAGPKLLRVDPAGTIHDDPTLLTGITLPYAEGRRHGVEAQIEAIDELGGWWTVQVGGTWPSSTFLTLAKPLDHEDPYAVYRWAGSTWSTVKARRGSYTAFPRVIRAWKEGSLLAWRDFYAPALDTDSMCSDCPDEIFETPEYEEAQRDMARAKQLTVPAGPAKGPALAGQSITAFDALPSGEAFVALRDGSLVVLGTTGAWTTVPPPDGSTGSLDGLVARAPDDVVGFGTSDDAPHLVRWNGHRLEPLEAPACAQGLASLSIAGDTWWATCASLPPRSYPELNMQERTGSLWRKQGAAAWDRVTLGKGAEARVVVARGEDDVWVSLYGAQGTATVLHTREHDPVIELGGMLEIVGDGFFGGARE